MTTAIKQLPPVVRADFGTRPAIGVRHRCLRALSTAMAVFIAVVAALGFAVAVATHLSARNQFTVLGHPVLTVLSGSMTPVIRSGDLIIENPVTAVQSRHLHAGQVVSFRAAPGSPVIITHRVIATRIVNGVVNYVTKGDANPTADTSLRPAGDVIGVVSRSIRYGGYILKALHNTAASVMLAVSVILWLIAGPLYRQARHLDASEQVRAAGRHRRAGRSRIKVPRPRTAQHRY